MDQSHYPILSDLFASAARVAVLRVFLLDPQRPYYQRQLEAATGLPIRAVQRELDRLTQAGLLFRRKEGNRVYYQVDEACPLFPDLRSMFLKAGSAVDRVRGSLAVDEHVRAAFMTAAGDRVLVVAQPGKRPAPQAAEGIGFELMPSEVFQQALTDDPQRLQPFLLQGVDILGRRDDAIWRHIEAAGFTVNKGDGVP